MHQPVASDVNCAIRRITNQKVWYLHSFEIDYNQAFWTSKFQKAHQFLNTEEANDFMRIFLGEERTKECDTFSEFEIWSI